MGIGFDATRGLQFREKLLFEQGRKKRQGSSLPRSLREAKGELKIPESLLREEAPAWPELSEPQVMRHFLRLSQQNYSIDTGFFPLGSCTMKYNPKINEEVARLEGFANLHPLSPPSWTQGAFAVLYELQDLLAEITGMKAVTLQPAAGAHGEYTALSMIRARLLERDGNARKKVLIPDTAHGTNPATCAMLGYKAVPVPSSAEGILSKDAVAALLDEDVAAIMITNPNTLGFFEPDLEAIAKMMHEKGAFVYCDGANMNALLGQARPGDMGVDAMHLNLHKTFSTPHGGGGPGSGPVCVTEELEAFLPSPRIEKVPGGHGVQDEADFFVGISMDLEEWDDHLPSLSVEKEPESYRIQDESKLSIGQVKAYWGNFGMHLRAYTYIREIGRENIKKVSEMAVLNANYLKERLSPVYHLPYETPCLHEVVLTDKWQRKRNDVHTRDISKGLIDLGFHPPTTYFPLCVQNAMMIEPTESESKETLDTFVEAMLLLDKKSQEEPEALKAAPELPLVGRVDETLAVRNPILKARPLG